MAIHIDDDANVDWLHKKAATKYTAYKSGKEVGSIDLTRESIKTEDEQLEEFFYLLLDEGNGDGPLTENDGSALVAALGREGYELKAITQ